ncbi:hypothetical protein DFJ74DRAFT_661636 [Hyaloraphidium curvatum]|nr:hypothetical protein DFJ74DRAFT_661636 [Hyaloraphidium curvatum]
MPGTIVPCEGGDVEINYLHTPIDYSHAFFNHVVNYMVDNSTSDAVHEMKAVEIAGRTSRPFVLANVHTVMPLNVTSKYDKGCRTLSWANPLEFARDFSRLGDPHDRSALLRSWTGGKLRDTITFVVVPSGKTVAFVVGKAEKQTDGKEERLGGAIQLRMCHLPEGCIAATTTLVPQEQRDRLADGVVDGDEDVTFDFHGALERCVQALEHERDAYAEEYGRFMPELLDTDGETDLSAVARVALERCESGIRQYTTPLPDGSVEFSWIKYVDGRFAKRSTTLVQITPKRIEQVKKVLAFMQKMSASRIQRAWRKHAALEELKAMSKEQRRTLNRALMKTQMGHDALDKSLAVA